MKERNGSTVTTLDSGVSSIVVAPNGAVFDLESSGALYEHTSSGWSFLDSGVKTIQLMDGGAILDLEQGGGLYRHNSGGWTLLGTGVASISTGPAPFMAQVTAAAGGTVTKMGITSWTANSGGTAFWDLLDTGSLWHYAGGAWSQVDSGVQAISTAANGTLIDLETSGALYIYNSGWNLLASGVVSYAVEGNQLNTYSASGARQFFLTTAGAYEWDSSGLSRFAGGTTALLDTNVTAFAGNDTAFVELEDNGQLWGHQSSGWTLLDVGVAAFATDSTGTNIYSLESNGNLRQFQTSTGKLSLTPLATSVAAIAATSSGTLYFLDTTGNLKQDVSGTITLVDQGVASFQLDGSGNLYELLTNGNLYEGNSTTTALATSVSAFQVAANGTVTTLSKAGALQQGSTTVATSVTSFQVAGSGTLYYLDAAGNLHEQGLGTALDTGVGSFTLSSTGLVYELKTNGTLVQILGTTTTTLDTKVGSFIVAPNGTLFDLESSGSLYQHTLAGWSFLDTGVKSIDLPEGGGILDLEQGEGLWQHNSQGWQKWASGVTTISVGVAPYQVMANTASGTSVLEAIQSTAGTAAAFADLLISGALWQYAGGSWSHLDSGVAAIAIDSKGTLYDLEQGGQLYSHNNSGWSFLDAGVKVIGLASDDTLIDLESNGNLWSHLTVWTRLDTQVTSFTVSGTQVTAVDQNGTKMFTV